MFDISHRKYCTYFDSAISSMSSLLGKLSGRENRNNNTLAFVFVAMAKLHSNKT